MHPWVILPEPGLCPICHMDLTPLDPAKLTGEIVIDPVVVQNIGVRLTPVTTGPLTKEIRTVGTITYDETATKDVNTKISGWIEQLDVDETGVQVKQGEPLFELYSPELYQAQEEYLVALNSRSQLSRNLLDDSRTKLEFFDIGPDQIKELEKRGKAKRTLTVTSPHTGIVIDKNAKEGMKIEPGMRVYQIADLSKVWVMATLYEYQLPYVKVGQPVVMTLEYLPNETFEGKVAYIYPYLQKESRQVKVRIEFANPDGVLKPGMFATLQLANTLDQQAVLAPREAIIATGTRKVAFVSLGAGKFEPRNVETGIETQKGLIEIRSGLKPGEEVVVSGQFLLDSESKMRSALAKMVRGDMASDQIPGGSTAVKTASTIRVPNAVTTQLSRLLNGYFAIGDSLAANSLKSLTASTTEISNSLAAMVDVPLTEAPDFWNKSSETVAIRAKAEQLAQATDLEAARVIYASLSQPMAELVKQIGVPNSFGQPIEAMTCPMYPPKVGGAVWLQPTGSARNPYMGLEMLRCVGDRTTLPVANTDSPSSDQAKLTDAVQSKVDALAVAYLELQRLLFENQTKGAQASLERIRQTATELQDVEDEALRSAAANVAKEAATPPAGLPAMRAAYKSLSAAMITLVSRVAPSSKAVPELREATCPMVDASWLQTSATVQNPYYGQGDAMADCGTVEKVFTTNR
ncbi:hypothetical protein GCM10023156_62090 [Novipirellula rosea]|uniref:Cation efflux system protein CusB n=2 Tax=Novipirellula rosea TaxID=1031540 RepID=A0ABP8NQE7_9BACT